MRMVADQPKGAIFSHKDLDAVFQNIAVISKERRRRGAPHRMPSLLRHHMRCARPFPAYHWQVNTKFLEALEAVENTWPMGEKKNPVDGSVTQVRTAASRTGA